jgi:hypothetical protein
MFASCSTTADAKRMYRQQALKHHPDVGGDNDVMVALNHAFDVRLSMLANIEREASQRCSTSVHEECETAERFRASVYHDHGWVGEQYDMNRSTKDIAKLIRSWIKDTYPGWKFSVRCDGWTAIFIELQSGPHYRESDEVRTALDRIKSHSNLYNYDRSDSQVDYFDTRFYCCAQASFGYVRVEPKPVKVRRAKRAQGHSVDSAIVMDNPNAA